jgi:hypothetical protein
MTELQEHPGSFVRIANINSQKHAFGAIEPETYSAGSLHFTELELIDRVRHLTGVSEDSHVESGKRFPSVLGIKHRHIPISEPRLLVAAQVFRAADCWL